MTNVNKETKKLIELARERGLRIEHGNNHIKVFGPSGLVCVLSRGRKNPGFRNLKMCELAIRKAT